MVCASFEKIIKLPSLDVVGVFCVREKAFDLNLSTFSPQPLKLPVTVSLKTQIRVSQLYKQPLSDYHLSSSRGLLERFSFELQTFVR